MNIKDLRTKLKLLVDTIRFKKGSLDKAGDNSTNPKIIAKEQLTKVALISLLIISVIYIVSRLIDNSSKATGNEALKAAMKHKPQKIEIQAAGSSIKPEQLWTSKLEDAIDQEKKSRELKEQEFLKTLKTETDKISKDKDEQIRKLEEQLKVLTSNVDEIKQKPKLSNEQLHMSSKINLSLVSPQTIKHKVKDLSHYIPASTFISGKLLGGISVSTSVNTAEEPVPVIVRLTDYARLPQEVKQNYKDCRVLGSCIGDISSERALVRLETLACIDKKNNRAVETKISGFIYGPDGLNGIKGRVVSMDSKHLRNAAIGGFLSGISKGLKDEGASNFSIFGAQTSKKGWDNKLQDAGVSGAGNAAEKLAEYHIKRADMISPVVQIPAGAKVDVVLSKGVFIGSDDIKDRIADERVTSQNQANYTN